MEIVINIPEEVVKAIQNGKDYRYDIHTAIAQGTPLPKGHGRLIDADILRSMYSINRANFNTVVEIQKWIDNAPTIIEADKELKDEKL